MFLLPPVLHRHSIAGERPADQMPDRKLREAGLLLGIAGSFVFWRRFLSPATIRIGFVRLPDATFALFAFAQGNTGLANLNRARLRCDGFHEIRALSFEHAAEKPFC